MTKLTPKETELIDKYEKSDDDGKALLREEIKMDIVQKHIEKYELQSFDLFGLLDQGSRTYIIKDCFTGETNKNYFFFETEFFK